MLLHAHVDGNFTRALLSRKGNGAMFKIPSKRVEFQLSAVKRVYGSVTLIHNGICVCAKNIILPNLGNVLRDKMRTGMSGIVENPVRRLKGIAKKPLRQITTHTLGGKQREQ